MNKIALAILAILIGFSSMAQSSDSTLSNRREFHNGQKHPGQNLQKLNLTDDQKTQIKTLNQNFRQQMQDLKNNSSLGADELKDKRQALIKEHKEKVDAILTPDQRKQADDMRKEFVEGNKGEMRNKRFEKMTKDLNLTPEQSTKIKEMNSTFRDNVKSIRQNTSLSQDEKKEQMKSLMAKHRADMEAILTNEQKQQLKNIRKNRRSEVVK